MALELYSVGGEAAWLRSFSWHAAFRPRFFETDALGHVSNVFYTAYIETARLDFLASLADPERESPHHLAFNHNAAEITLRFVKPCFYDEPLDLHAKFAKLGRSSAVLEHAITGTGESDIRTVAQVAIVRIVAERPAPWTDAQRALIEPLVR